MNEETIININVFVPFLCRVEPKQFDSYMAKVGIKCNDYYLAIGTLGDTILIKVQDKIVDIYPKKIRFVQFADDNVNSSVKILEESVEQLTQIHDRLYPKIALYPIE